MKYELNLYEAFYIYDRRGPHGLSFSESLEFESLDAQNRHDYFQWLFPTNLESTFNKEAPFLDEQLISLIHKIKPSIRIALNKFRRYLENHKSWPNPTDHNNLRISRILRSLNLLDMTPEADSFYIWLLKIAESNQEITKNNLDHFRSAMFDKHFFIIAPQEFQQNIQEILQKTLPDHKILFINESDKEGFIELGEPVFTIISNQDLKDIKSKFMKSRFWY